MRLAAVLCAVAGAALWSGPFILRDDLYANDAAQHIFWLYRFVDPGLFPNDLTVRFFSLPSSAAWGYRGLYATIAPLVDVLFAAEVLAAALLLLSVWLAWLIGRTVVTEEHRELGGLISAVTVLWLVTQHADVMTPLALQRGFALPIMLLFLWALVARRYAWVGVAWLLAALIYPVIIVVLGIAGTVVFLRDFVRDHRPPPMWFWNGIAGVAALAIVLVSSGTPPDIGPTLSGSQALSLPEFGSQGRVRLFIGTFRGDWISSQVVGLGWPSASLLTIGVATTLTFIGDRRARLPTAVWIFLFCGLAVWLVARFTLFELYLPNRHSRWTIAAFAVAAFACAGVVVLERITRYVGARASASGKAMSAAISLAAILIVVAVFLPAAKRTWQTPVDRDMERAYAYLATLPRDTLIAAHPDVADFVPLRSKRAVLASTETSLSFMQGYYQRIKPRLEASLRAAYASNWAELDKTLAPYGVIVMLSAPAVWSKERYYEPFNALVSELRTRGKRKGFILKEPSAERVVFQSGGVFVVRVGPDPAARSE